MFPSATYCLFRIILVVWHPYSIRSWVLFFCNFKVTATNTLCHYPCSYCDYCHLYIRRRNHYVTGMNKCTSEWVSEVVLVSNNRIPILTQIPVQGIFFCEFCRLEGRSSPTLRFLVVSHAQLSSFELVFPLPNWEKIFDISAMNSGNNIFLVWVYLVALVWTLEQYSSCLCFLVLSNRLLMRQNIKDFIIHFYKLVQIYGLAILQGPVILQDRKVYNPNMFVNKVLEEVY